ncbi:MAG: MFS transporter [Pseudomonadales bacterium]|nr:MFS transporter [Pseudomonadales bacterium]MCP5171985.1 MFS transporter [Pseudomonadales bacterium]
MNSPVSSAQNSFRPYLNAIGSAHTSEGIRQVVFPWLVVGVLGLSADKLGLAQMVMMLPNLLLLLWGGAISDNRHLGSYLFRLYLLYSVPFIVLIGWSLLFGFSFVLIIVFGLSFGLITPFVQPAKESLLAQVTAQAVQGAIAKTTFVQFSANSVGILIASLMEQVGLYALLVAQVVMYVAAAYFFRNCHSETNVLAKKTTTLRDVVSGVQLVWGNTQLRQLMSLVAITSFVGLAVYLVAIAFLARDVYQGGASFFAVLQFCFMAGVVVANGLFIRFHHLLKRLGRALLLCYVFRAVLLLLISLRFSAEWAAALVFIWGCFYGLSTTLARSLAFSEAPSEYRSRVVSIFQLCLFGAAPFGAFAAGLLVESLGVLVAIKILSGVILLTALVGVFKGPLWNFRH